MYLNYDSETYPFVGTFYRMTYTEGDSLIDQVEKREDVLVTRCDITEGGLNKNPKMVSASFSVYFPFDKEEGVKIRLGDTFEGNLYGMDVNGKVIGVFPTQLMGCVAYIEDLDV